ncbi:SUN domain-containing protein 3 [Seminavis robusta]|uniref:SUN domain-containing protein 3 n=1 Tax=Seminavis robusta TaxID=568900 RepID=A0A9N8E5M2_9STRA|nr:SUN domain-containing protein 3 [Seminavis robusta]|eukprot:Sro696_g188940.1 SUN domain-containing protein 3 (609) ;mRNA; r:33184-35147
MSSSRLRRPLVAVSLHILLVVWSSSFLVSLANAATNNNLTGLEMLDPESRKARQEEVKLDRKLKKAFDMAKRTLDDYNDAKSKLSTLSHQIVQDDDGLGTKLQEIEDLKEAVATKAERIDKRIRDLNAEQILELKKEMEELRKRELQRREKLKEKEEREATRREKQQQKLEAKREKAIKKREKEKKKKKMKKKKQMKKKQKTIVPEGAITKAQLQNLVDVKAIVKESDEKLEDWCVKLVEEEVAALQEELEEVVIEATTALGELGNEMRKAVEEPEVVDDNDDEAAPEVECSGATLVDAVHLVQESLVKYSHDTVGMVDHLAQASVVHFLTSDNYVPAAKQNSPIDAQWWFQYLPDDWERGLDAIMPVGWRKWNVAIPDYVYHTFGFHKMAATAPPEAILTPHLYPGSCWPMAGSSGQVTLRLQNPVKVRAVTMDHAPELLFEDPFERKSAPKTVRVFGFPPCWVKQAGQSDYIKDDYLDEGNDSDEDDADYVRGLCPDGLNFDIQKPIVLHDFEYNISGPSIQTFQIPLPEEEIEEDEGGDGGTCAQDTGTCGGGMEGNDALFSSPDRSDSINEGVNAIRLQVTDNWGNADYTCIYRFRIHGDTIED